MTHRHIKNNNGVYLFKVCFVQLPDNLSDLLVGPGTKVYLGHLVSVPVAGAFGSRGIPALGRGCTRCCGRLLQFWGVVILWAWVENLTNPSPYNNYRSVGSVSET